MTFLTPNKQCQSTEDKDEQIQMELGAKDVLPNINRTKAPKRAEKMPYFVPGDLDL